MLHPILISWSKSTLRVSGFTLEPVNITAAPIIIFSASAKGTKKPLCPTCDKRFMAMSGDQAPIINPPLYAKPEALFLIYRMWWPERYSI